jgi:predicted RNase H-like nuclease (RuvC/YqgF family)
MSEYTTEEIRRVREALREADLMLGALAGAGVVERELQARVDALVAANMQLEGMRAQARREQRAAEERCEDLEADLRQRDKWIEALERTLAARKEVER